MYDLISTPSVVVELEQVTENLKKMDALNRTYGIRVRPHIKPHKSVYFALEQLSCGARGITCAKLSEAETMADYGIDDIFIESQIGNCHPTTLFRVILEITLDILVKMVA